jgi:uncharacterized protein (DUF2147 family)
VPTARHAALGVAAALAAWPALADSAPRTDTAGYWYTEDHRGVIRVAPCGGGAYCGMVVGVSDWRKDGSAPVDVDGRSQCQLVIIKNMVMGDDGRRHGTVTDPTDGKTYDAILWVGDDGVLRLRGYIGLPALGSTQHWEHFPGHVRPDCHFTPN